MKKLKRMIIFILFLCMAVILKTNYSYAATVKFGLYNKDNGRPSGFYTVGTTSDARTKSVIKIVEYNSTGDTMNTSKLNQMVYCLRAGLGFGEEGASHSDDYTVSRNMRETSTEITNYKTLIGGEANYKKLMWILDNICDPINTNSVNALLAKVGDFTREDIKSDSNAKYQQDNYIQDAIEVVQQGAMWYITNSNDTTNQPNKNFSFAIKDSKLDSSSTALSTLYGLADDENPLDSMYQYLITNASESYDYTKQSAEPLKFTSTSAKVTHEGNYALVGPYKIEKINNYTNFSAKVSNGASEIQNVTIKKGGSTVSGSSTSNKIEQTIGNEFYIQLPYNTSGTIKIDISANYNARDITYYTTSASTANTKQPLVMINDTSKTYSATNSQSVEEPKTNIKVSKTWSDSNNQDGLRTTSVEVELLKNGASFGKTATLSDSNAWSTTFSGLSIKDENGADIAYTVRENNVPNGYSASVSGTASNGFTITNSHTPATTSISVNKVWNDSGNQDGLRTQSIVVQLMSNGVATNQEKTLNQANSWRATFDNLPTHSGGSPITYSVQEKEVPSGYTQSLTGSASGGFTITNNHTPAVTSINVSKAWVDGENQDAIRPTEVVIELLCDNSPTGDELTLNAQNSWKGKFENLVASEGGRTKTYSVREKNVPQGYTSAVTGDAVTGFTVTNTHKPEETQVTVVKSWNDNGNKFSSRPSEITVELLKNGSILVQEQKLNEGNNWRYTFTGLPAKNNGQPINYTVREKTIPNGYKAAVTGDMANGYTITNTNKIFDLALRKYITKINGKTLDELNISSRTPNISEDTLTSGSTATYKHKKDPILVQTGDIVTYSISIYNEGQKSGYASQIIDQLPTGLVCAQTGTVVSKDKDGKDKNTFQIKYDSQNNIVTFDIVNTTGKPAKDLKPYQANELDYETIEINCRVEYKAIYGQKDILTNTAWISNDFDTEENAPGKDIDSQPSNHPGVDKDNMENYKGKTTNPDDLTDKDHYYEGEQDDDDFEKIYVTMFDLAMRKFITAVNGEELITDGEYDRAPKVDVSPLLNGEDTAKYNHTKEPLRLHFNDIITYTLRIFNEGEVDGYATEITEHLPPELEFLPDDDINKKYLWVVDSTDTTGRTIKTNYLSEEKNAADNLIKGFNGEGTLDYKDLQIRCRIRPNAPTSKNLTNIAEITKSDNEYDLPDRDNKEEVKKPEDKDLPDYKGKETNKDDLDDKDYHYEGQEDDDDFEKVYVQIFDLALRKWVSQVILIEDGVQKEMDTGHYAEQEPEPVVKVELNKERVENTIVKFRYQIRITNEGEIEGYATEISDYIPKGLVFKQADNPKWKEVDGKIITDQLKDTLLKPGESAIVDVVLTWVNSAENLDLKINTAEISKDDNPYGEPDIDSTPDNQKNGEDDIDDAPVILTIVTGSNTRIIVITFVGMILIVGLGAVIIKKYVV